MLVIILLIIILLFLGLEKMRAARDRAKLTHIVYVNGIRGKSSTTRLIYAGLCAGGYRVFCKTTGTIPMTIDPNSTVCRIRRHGRANINEQLKILHRAARAGTQILVIECMAVNPALQWVTQHRMLKADIGVITNVRIDHTAEMGETLEDICDSLSNTIPQNGILFTADKDFWPRIRENGEKLNCQVKLASPTGAEPEIDFPENVALALAVCQHLGVDSERALKGMLNYQRDPYALSIHWLPNDGVFVNGMSINDPQSTEMVLKRMVEKYSWQNRELILIINSRSDRGYRARHMIMVVQKLRPAKVWLLGASKATMKLAVHQVLPNAQVLCFQTPKKIPIDQLTEKTVAFAIGNLAGPGQDLIAQIRKEAKKNVP